MKKKTIGVRGDEGKVIKSKQDRNWEKVLG